MRVLKHICLILFCLPVLSFARGDLLGYCTQGGAKVFQNGTPSTTQVMQSYPQCSVSVFYSGGASGTATSSGTTLTWAQGTLFNANSGWAGLTITYNGNPFTIASVNSQTSITTSSSLGTNTLPLVWTMPSTAPAAIYDSTGTAKTNPFASSLTGLWQFYADNGQYDIRLVGGGIPAPFTWSNQDLIDPSSLPNTASDLICTTVGCLSTICGTAAVRHQTLLLSRMWDLNGTCAASIYAYAGGGFRPTSGHTTTLTGPFDGDGTLHLDTSSSGSIALTIPSVVNFLWFGASTAASDNSTVYASAFATLPTTGGTISIPCGDFKGRFIWPAYPKSITIGGAGTCTILEEPTANSGIVTSSPITANFTSGSNTLQNVSLKPHNSSTTSKAVDMRGQNRGIYQHIWLQPASNSTGHFGVGFYCSTATALYTACYDNLVDDVTALVQVGPTTVVETQEFAAVNTFSRFHILGLTATTTIFFLNSPNNKIEASDIEGNTLATVAHIGGGFNIISGPNDWEGNDKEVFGDSNGYQLLIDGGSIGTGLTSQITCDSQQSGWVVRNVSGITNKSQLTGCVNAQVIVGSSMDGFAPRALIGGISTNQVSTATGQTVTEFPLGSGGLAAGAYTYYVTGTTAGGETLPVTFGPITISNHSGIQLFFSGNATMPYYTVYGRSCPTTATCKVIKVVVPEGNAGGGMFFDDGSLTPSGASPLNTRDSSGDLNVNGRSGGDGATASYIFTSGGVNYGTEDGANFALNWTSLNGPNMAFQAFPYAAGFPICMYTTHALRAGANTITINGVGGAFSIKKGTDFNADLTTAIAANNMVCLTYNTVKNVFQYQGQ